MFYVLVVLLLNNGAHNSNYGLLLKTVKYFVSLVMQKIVQIKVHIYALVRTV
ncbi:unnamed protein product [Trichobilharzia regenti]|nr:unnamed protein product [Trichobilharzia regenti]